MKYFKLLLAAIAAMVSLSASAQSWTGSDPAAGTFFLYNVGAGKFINVGDKSAGWGTNAYLTAEYGLDFTFEANGTAYNLNTQVSNGGANYYLAPALWCDGAATPWTFTKVDRTDINAYTIRNGESYIVANAAGTDIEYVALSGTERDQWQIIGRSDILANLQANTAAGVKRTQATFFISSPDFGRNDLRVASAWPYTRTGGNATVAGPSGNVQNYGCEFWDNTFDIHQDLTNLPNGIYEFEIYGYGTNGTTYIYATTTEGTTEKVFKNQTGASNFQTALNNIDNYGGNVTGLVQVTDGKLTIGVKRETNNGGDWTVIDQARLYYYGDYTFAEAYGADLKDLIASAQALVAAAPAFLSTTALETAISTAQGVMSTGTTETEFSTATTDLQSAIDTYNAQLTLVSRYADIRTAALAIASGMDVTAADAAAAAATNSDEIAAAIATLRAAFLAELPNVTVPTDGLDVTAVMVDNASVAQNTNYWTIANLSENGGSAGVCNYGECEFYNRNFKFYQTLALSKGSWEFGVTGFHRAGNHSTYFYAGTSKVLIPGVESSVVNNMAEANDFFDAGNGKVSVKFSVDPAGDVEIGIDNQDTETDKWTIFRNFTLKYFGEAIDLTPYKNLLAEAVAKAQAVEGTVPAAIYSTLEGVVSENNKTYTSVADYETAISNIESATATARALAISYDEYKTVKAQVEALKSVEGYTETTSGATTTLTAAIAAADAEVNAATTADAIAAQIAPLKAAGKTFITSVRSDGAHPFDITFLITNPSFDNNDATGWTATPAPGFQSYTNCEYYYANTRTFDINQTLTDMPKGNYELKVQAFQRPGWFEAVYDAYKAGNNKVTSVIYINDGQTTIKNLVSEGATTSEAQWQSNNDSNKDGKYYANSMNGASKAFAAGYYWNTVLTAVEGDLKFGFKTTSESVDGDWTIFDNFQLYYYGTTDPDNISYTARNYTIKYGDPLPDFSYDCTPDVVSQIGEPNISCEATQASNVGTYPIVITRGSVTNSDATFVNGTLTITKAPLTVRLAENYSCEEGEPIPEFELAYSGWKLNETVNVLTQRPSATTTATIESRAGTYPISISGGSADNYELAYTPGVLTITALPLTSLGDVNRDNKVSVADVVLTANHLLGLSPSPFNIRLADANNDGGVDVADIVEEVDIISNKMFDANVKGQWSGQENYLSGIKDGNVMYIHLQNATDYVAFQMTLTIQDDTDFNEVKARLLRSTNHQLAIGRINEHQLKIIVYSLDNQPITGHVGNLLTISGITGEVLVEDILFVTSHGRKSCFAPFIPGQQTGLQSLSVSNIHHTDAVFNMSGQLMSPSRPLKKGFYISNGKKIIQK